MTPDDVQDDDADDVVDDPDQDAIETESPRPADDDRYAWLEGNLGDVVIFDERNPWAWVSSEDAEDLDDWE